MHKCKLGRDNKITRIYNYLKTEYPFWKSGLMIAENCAVIAPSTFVSMIRQQMPPGEILEKRKEGRLTLWRIISK